MVTLRTLSRAADKSILGPDALRVANPSAPPSWEDLVSEMRVLIVDDEEDMRALVRATIEVANEGLSVAGEAADGETAVATWRKERPQVVVLDQRMPGVSGLETAGRILEEHPGQAIVLFSSYLDPDVLAAARRLGIRVCLSKDNIRQLPEVLWRTDADTDPGPAVGGGLVP
jgi:CheY-like chemotaxis protein